MTKFSTCVPSIQIFKKAAFFLIVFLACWAPLVHAQTSPITFTLVKQPCDNDGILVAHTSGIVPPITFNWNINGMEITQVSDSASDTLFNYSGAFVDVFTSNSPEASGYYNGSPPFSFTVDTASAVCPALGTVTATVTGGIAPFTYQWFNSNNVIIDTGNPVMLPAGHYTLLITDSAGCQYGNYGSGPNGGQYSGVLVQNVSPVKDTILTTPANCTNGVAIVSNVHGGTLPYTFLWSNGAQTDTITGLKGGGYQVTVTDAKGCYTSAFFNLQQSVEINTHTTLSDPTCIQNNGSAIAFGSGGVTPYSYLWSNGQQSQTVNGLVAGVYYVTVTDANNCTGETYAYLTSTTPITVTYTTTASSCTSPTGSASINITGGTPPYTEAWGTYPEQTSTSATNLNYGTYNFTVNDSVGCTRFGTVYVPPISAVTGSIYEANATCTESNGSATMDVATGTAPYTYSWSNGGTGPSIKNITPGSYSVTVTDKLQCTVTKYTYVQSSSPIQLSLIPTEASCIFNHYGQIAATATGGTSPYTYSWSNGETTATDTGLVTGRYWLYVQDSVGCVQDNWTDVGYNSANNSCYCTISGKVYVDSNANCIPEPNEAGIQNVMIHLSGLGYAFTDAHGNYSFLAPTGSYTLSEKVQAYYPLSPCQSDAIPLTVTAASGCIDTANFGNVINPLHDISICTISYNNPPVVGYQYTQRIVVQNNGTVTESNIQLGYANDGQLQLVGEAPPLFTQLDPVTLPNWYSIVDTFPTLAPGAKQTFDVTYNVPPDIPLNTTVVFHDTTAYAPPISNWLQDYTPWNNVNTYQAITVGSFDPNEKEVTPLGTGAEGFIKTTDSILTYTVRFQNCGTYPAQKVVVIDTLSNNLDFTTLVPGYSNHAYVADMSESGIAKFTFSNINLPDSSGMANASIGVIMYSVQQKPNLPGGSIIISPATVYFDFNAGVQTNVTINTIEAVTAVAEVQQAPFSFNLYPNPTAGHIQLAIQSEETIPCTIRFYNVTGQLIRTDRFQMDKGNNTLSTEIQSFSPGLYFVEISDGQYVTTKKLTVIE